MTTKNNLYSMTDTAIMKDLWEFIKYKRLQKNVSQHQLSLKTGLHRSTISQLECGKRPATLLTFIQILRGLDLLETLNAFNVEEEPISPMLKAKEQNMERKHAYKKMRK